MSCIAFYLQAWWSGSVCVEQLRTCLEHHWKLSHSRVLTTLQRLSAGSESTAELDASSQGLQSLNVGGRRALKGTASAKSKSMVNEKSFIVPKSTRKNSRKSSTAGVQAALSGSDGVWPDPEAVISMHGTSWLRDLLQQPNLEDERMPVNKGKELTAAAPRAAYAAAYDAGPLDADVDQGFGAIDQPCVTAALDDPFISAEELAMMEELYDQDADLDLLMGLGAAHQEQQEAPQAQRSTDWGISGASADRGVWDTSKPTQLTEHDLVVPADVSPTAPQMSAEISAEEELLLIDTLLADASTADAASREELGTLYDPADLEYLQQVLNGANGDLEADIEAWKKTLMDEADPGSLPLFLDEEPSPLTYMMYALDKMGFGGRTLDLEEEEEALQMGAKTLDLEAEGVSTDPCSYLTLESNPELADAMGCRAMGEEAEAQQAAGQQVKQGADRTLDDSNDEESFMSSLLSLKNTVQAQLTQLMSSSQGAGAATVANRLLQQEQAAPQEGADNEELSTAASTRNAASADSKKSEAVRALGQALGVSRRRLHALLAQRNPHGDVQAAGSRSGGSGDASRHSIRSGAYTRPVQTAGAAVDASGSLGSSITQEDNYLEYLHKLVALAMQRSAQSALDPAYPVSTLGEGLSLDNIPQATKSQFAAALSNALGWPDASTLTWPQDDGVALDADKHLPW